MPYFHCKSCDVVYEKYYPPDHSGPEFVLIGQQNKDLQLITVKSLLSIQIMGAMLNSQWMKDYSVA